MLVPRPSKTPSFPHVFVPYLVPGEKRPGHQRLFLDANPSEIITRSCSPPLGLSGSPFEISPDSRSSFWRYPSELDFLHVFPSWLGQDEYTFLCSSYCCICRPGFFSVVEGRAFSIIFPSRPNLQCGAPPPPPPPSFILLFLDLLPPEAGGCTNFFPCFSLPLPFSISDLDCQPPSFLFEEILQTLGDPLVPSRLFR